MREIVQEIVYTYDVKWEHSDTKWASRWDLYLYMGDDQIHWCASVAWFGVVAIECIYFASIDLSYHS